MLAATTPETVPVWLAWKIRTDTKTTAVLLCATTTASDKIIFAVHGTAFIQNIRDTHGHLLDLVRIAGIHCAGFFQYGDDVSELGCHQVRHPLKPVS
jgi:acetyl esterase/lipase